jgi:hypothetical protein
MKIFQTSINVRYLRYRCNGSIIPLAPRGRVAPISANGCRRHPTFIESDSQTTSDAEGVAHRSMPTASHEDFPNIYKRSIPSATQMADRSVSLQWFHNTPRPTGERGCRFSGGDRVVTQFPLPPGVRLVRNALPPKPAFLQNFLYLT